jgi:hypothetical protein
MLAGAPRARRGKAARRPQDPWWQGREFKSGRASRNTIEGRRRPCGDGAVSIWRAGARAPAGHVLPLAVSLDKSASKSRPMAANAAFQRAMATLAKTLRRHCAATTKRTGIGKTPCRPRPLFGCIDQPMSASPNVLKPVRSPDGRFASRRDDMDRARAHSCGEQAHFASLMGTTVFRRATHVGCMRTCMQRRLFLNEPTGGNHGYV